MLGSTAAVLVFFLCVRFNRKCLCSWGDLRLTYKRIIKVSWIFSNFSFWEESVNRNSIIMISKGYHYVINLGIVSNFYISIDLVYPWSLQRTYRSRWTQGNLRSPFPLDPQTIIYDEFRHGIIGIAPIKSLCFIFTIPVCFIHSTI